VQDLPQHQALAQGVMMAGSTSARGYGWNHQKERARYQQRMDAGEVFVCSKCRRHVNPRAWDLAHLPGDKTQYLGPQHIPCNRNTTAEKRTSRMPSLRRWRL
jgi:hypothetical protein